MHRYFVGLSILAAVTLGCSQPSSTQPSSMAVPSSASAGSASLTTATSNPNGVGGTTPAFYDDELFTINLMMLPPGGESATIAHNGSINTIYQSDGCHPGGHDFVNVLDAIQGDGFNPLWREVQVVFNNPAACKQFTSDNDILAAAAAHMVSLQTTSDLYRCSVIGKK